MIRSWPTFVIAVLFVFLGLGVGAADDAPPASRKVTGDWALETLRTKDGRTFRGLVQAEDTWEIEFVEVIRPPGKDMYMVVRPVPLEDVAEVHRLTGQEHRQLVERIARFKHRLWIEAGELDDVRLTATMEDGDPAFVYDGPWFRLRSTSDEETTRRAVVHMEQIFRAYRQALPPRTQPKARLEVILYGSMEAYRVYLARKGLEIDHPAFFSAESNVIVAGADLAQYAERLKQIREENRRVEAQYAALNRAFPQRQRAMAEQLRKAGFNSQQIQDELRVRGKAWEDQLRDITQKITEVNRRNEARFEEVSRQLFARLRHEAFHAYLENNLFPQAEYAFPRWLNEGLAQVFESGRLDGDTLRIDAPNRELLLRLQQDLTGGYHLPLAEVVSAGEEAFLATHARARPTERHYLYAWGVAWRLLFDYDILRSERLQDYVRRDAASRSPIERFEKLVGQRLPEFERQWREAMLTLRPSVR